MWKILIVDDDYFIRKLYQYVFSDLGYEVETAENGSDGLEKVPVFKPDCMLIEISMPEMTGDEFARKLRENPDPGYRDVPFIILTGEARMNGSLQYAFQDNASCRAFLSKMTKPGDVVRTVQNILKAHK